MLVAVYIYVRMCLSHTYIHLNRTARLRSVAMGFEMICSRASEVHDHFQARTHARTYACRQVGILFASEPCVLCSRKIAILKSDSRGTFVQTRSFLHISQRPLSPSSSSSVINDIVSACLSLAGYTARLYKIEISHHGSCPVLSSFVWSNKNNYKRERQ